MPAVARQLRNAAWNRRMLAGGSGVQAAFSWLKSRTTTRPPRFAAAVIERTAVAGSASHWSTRAAVTMSNAVSNGSAPASATSNDRPGTPPWAARAFSIIAALTSTPPERLARIARTPEGLASAGGSVDAAVLTRRPAPKSWAPTEVICHLRDNEEWFLERMRLIVVMDLPRFVATNPDRWADERQYLTND